MRACGESLTKIGRCVGELRRRKQVDFQRLAEMRDRVCQAEQQHDRDARMIATLDQQLAAARLRIESVERRSATLEEDLERITLERDQLMATFRDRVAEEVHVVRAECDVALQREGARAEAAERLLRSQRRPSKPDSIDPGLARATKQGVVNLRRNMAAARDQVLGLRSTILDEMGGLRERAGDLIVASQCASRGPGGPVRFEDDNGLVGDPHERSIDISLDEPQGKASDDGRLQESFSPPTPASLIHGIFSGVEEEEEEEELEEDWGEVVQPRTSSPAPRRVIQIPADPPPSPLALQSAGYQESSSSPEPGHPVAPAAPLLHSEVGGLSFFELRRSDSPPFRDEHGVKEDVGSVSEAGGSSGPNPTPRLVDGGFGSSEPVVEAHIVPVVRSLAQGRLVRKSEGRNSWLWVVLSVALFFLALFLIGFGVRFYAERLGR